MKLRDLIEVSRSGKIQIIYRELFSLSGDWSERSMFYTCYCDQPYDIPLGLWQSNVNTILYSAIPTRVRVEGVLYHGRFYETEFDASIAMVDEKYE